MKEENRTLSQILADIKINLIAQYIPELDIEHTAENQYIAEYKGVRIGFADTLEDCIQLVLNAEEQLNIIKNDDINKAIKNLSLRINKPEWIVFHYTAGASSKKGSAKQVCNVFDYREASADFIVDDEEIVQYNQNIDQYYSWAVGDSKKNTLGGSLNNLCKNSNSISIELCSNLRQGSDPNIPNHSGWYFTNATLSNGIKIARELMNQYNIDKNHICRHYDVTGKLCPGIIGWNQESGDESGWYEFLNAI